MALHSGAGRGPAGGWFSGCKRADQVGTALASIVLGVMSPPGPPIEA